MKIRLSSTLNCFVNAQFGAIQQKCLLNLYKIKYFNLKVKT